MLILICTVVMFGVETSSMCSDLCECDNYSSSSSSSSSSTYNNNDNNNKSDDICEFGQCNLNVDQQNFISELSSNNNITVNFINSNTVAIKTSDDNNINLSAQINWITTLILTENNFTETPEFISKLDGVHTLDLSWNCLTSFDSYSPMIVNNLRVLNLSSNVISSVSNISFQYLSNLTNLDVSSNDISVLEEVVELPYLQYLNLSNNNLRTLNFDVFEKLEFLQELDVSMNELVSMSIVELPSLINLLIGGNVNLGKSRDIFFVGNSRKLQYLDASVTGLQQVPPTILTRSIRHLVLKKNLIRSIRGGDLDSYPLLNSLDATCNQIEFIEEDSLGRLEFLSFLYLTENRLVDIPRRLPEKLKVLHLDSNEIAMIGKKDLRGLSLLEVLFLNDNNVTVINDGAFDELTSLLKLDLSGNPIINLRTGIFAGPLSLEVLGLSAIKQPMDEDNNSQFPLSTPERLVSLNLSSSPGLAHQFLSDTATLMAAKRLQELDLTAGNLEFIRQDLQFFLPQLKLLHINGNKFNDTQLRRTRSWLCLPTENNEALHNVIITTLMEDYNYEFSNRSTSTPSSAGDSKRFDENVEKNWARVGDGLTTTRHVNEDEDFRSNEVLYHTTGVVESKFSQDLLHSPYEKYSDGSEDENNEIVRSESSAGAFDKNDYSTLKWNVSSSGEISMYKSERKNGFLPTLFLVVISILLLILFAIALILAIRFIKIRRTHVDDIEATNLPTISDIW